MPPNTYPGAGGPCGRPLPINGIGTFEFAQGVRLLLPFRVAWLSSLACMSASTISIADMLEIQLRKWIGKRHVANIKLSPSYWHPSAPIGEVVIAEIVDRSGHGLFFTGSGFTIPGHDFISNGDVTAAEWISSELFGLGGFVVTGSIGWFRFGWQETLLAKAPEDWRTPRRWREAL